MTDVKIETDEDAIYDAILGCEVCDAALEAAAGSAKDKAGSFTLAFCSGLDTCPA